MVSATAQLLLLEPKQQQQQKLGKNRGLLKPSWAFVQTENGEYKKQSSKKTKNVRDPNLGMKMSDFHISVNNSQIRMISLKKIVFKLLLIHFLSFIHQLPSNFLSFSAFSAFS